MKQLFRTFKYSTLASLIALMSLTSTSALAAEEHRVPDFTTPLPQMDSTKDVKPLEFRLPSFERFVVDGVPVIFTRLNELPMVDVSLVFESGSARDGDKHGLANLTAEMLMQGTTKLDEEAFLVAIDSLGISLSTAVDKDNLIIHLRSLSNKETLAQAAALVNQMATIPAFDEQALERTKGVVGATINRREGRPAYLATKRYEQEVFVGSGYAHPVIGTTDSIKLVNLADVKAYHAKYLVAKNASLTITGNLDSAGARSLATTILKGLNQGQKATPVTLPATLAQRTIRHVHVNNNSKQTAVIIGQSYLPLGNSESDYVQNSRFVVGNEALAGGNFNARLMDEIREKKGYVYGISGEMQRLAGASDYRIDFATQTDQASDAIRDTLHIINDTIKDGIREDEFALAQNLRAKSYPMGFASNAAIHKAVTTLNAGGRSDSYVVGELGRINAVTLAEANQSLKDVLPIKDMLVVTVGPQKPQVIDPTANQGMSQTNQSANPTSQDNK